MWLLHAGGVPWRHPHSCDSRDYAQELQPSMHLLTRCLLVNGHLSTSPALLIDRSAEPVEASLPL